MGEHAWGQKSELVPRKVQAEETSEATPAQGRGEVRQGGGVVQRAAEVELLEGTGRNAESFWVDECEPVPAEVKEVQVEEGREAVGIQHCDPVEITVAVTSVYITFMQEYSSRYCKQATKCIYYTYNVPLWLSKHAYMYQRPTSHLLLLKLMLVTLVSSANESGPIW